MVYLSGERLLEPCAGAVSGIGMWLKGRRCCFGKTIRAKTLSRKEEGSTSVADSNLGGQLLAQPDGLLLSIDAHYQ